ncbi:Uncharacterised protein [Mycobacteroides abscessus subsp. abscessus]|nr:Uncharacterised protein [Mycobacteroides abscessus subsp. abscessus]
MRDSHLADHAVVQHLRDMSHQILRVRRRPGWCEGTSTPRGGCRNGEPSFRETVQQVLSGGALGSMRSVMGRQ